MIRQPDYNRAATMACRCLVRLNVTSLPVRPLDILRRCRNTAVYTYQQAAEHLQIEAEEFERRYGGADAFTMRCGNRYVVCYRQGGNPARLNFTLAHELGHILLNHVEDEATDEAEANCFAGHLLCPDPVLPGHTADTLATACYVSRGAAQAALSRRLGTPEKAICEKVEKLFKKELDKPRKI